MSRILMGFVGDVLINREHSGEVFRHVRDVLKAPAVMFANLEGAYTDDPRPGPGIVGGCSGPTKALDAYIDAGFNVMSLANNHILDVGYAAMLDNKRRLAAAGVHTCGAGETLAEARRPALIAVDGVRIAILGYASMFPIGHEARFDSPGLAPMRAYNFWSNPYPYLHAPGVQPVERTVPDETDLAHLSEDIARARENADLVVASFHWGDYERPFHLTDHEKRTARHCIDQGADLVIGHHHHALRGMEWYNGKPIMYGLGHFVFDLKLIYSPADWTRLLSEMDPAGHRQKTYYGIGPRAGWPYLPMHEDTWMTMLAWAVADKTGVTDIGFLPCRLAPDGAVHPLHHDTPEARAVVDYVERCNSTQGLNSAMVAEGAVEIAGYQTIRVVPGDKHGPFG